MYTFKTETYFVVGYRKLQNIIKKEFLKEINLLSDQAYSKDRVSIVVNGVVSTYDKRRIRFFINNGDYDFILGALMNDLASKNKIPKGSYFIQFDGKDVEKELY